MLASQQAVTTATCCTGDAHVVSMGILVSTVSQLAKAVFRRDVRAFQAVEEWKCNELSADDGHIQK